jgi:plastocyanin
VNGSVRSRWAVVSLAAAIACSRPAPRAPAPNVVTITATDYAFGMPDTIGAGVTTIRLVNRGKELHHASLVQLDGKTIIELQRTAPPPWKGFVGGPNTISPGDTASATLTLDPGTYAVACWIPSADGMPHVMKGMLHPLSVTARATPVPPQPAADVTIKLTDYDFVLSQPLTAGWHVVRVENAGAQAHEITIAALLPGKTLRDFIAFEAAGEKGPLPTGEWLGGVTALDAGGRSQFATTLKRGSYLLLCFWPDAKDGKPHILHGMMKEIRVS